MLTLGQVVERTGLARGTLMWHILRGNLRAQRIGHFWVVEEAALQEFLQRGGGQRKKRTAARAGERGSRSTPVEVELKEDRRCAREVTEGQS